jgi:rhodanese-related sulfurtransferase
MKNSFLCSLFACAALAPVYATAANVEFRVAEDQAYPLVEQDAGTLQAPDTADPIGESFSRPSKPCPPFCVNTLNIEHDVATVSELDVIKFRDNLVYEGRGVLVDTRTSDWYQKETIPGSVNVPFTVFERPMDDPELVAVLEQLGAKQRQRVGVIMRTLEKAGLFNGDMKTADWDYSDTKALLLWCNGPWCDQSPRAIRALISLGYPADRIFYYRGGMQMWQTLGLETVAPADLSSYASK